MIRKIIAARRTGSTSKHRTVPRSVCRGTVLYVAVTPLQRGDTLVTLRPNALGRVNVRRTRDETVTP